jgi:hypothetical protein
MIHEPAGDQRGPGKLAPSYVSAALASISKNNLVLSAQYALNPVIHSGENHLERAMPNFKTCLAVFFFVSLPISAQQPTPAYKNPHLAISDRVADLLPRMTLEEKIEQITGGQHENTGFVDPTGQVRYASPSLNNSRI